MNGARFISVAFFFDIPAAALSWFWIASEMTDPGIRNPPTNFYSIHV